MSLLCLLNLHAETVVIQHRVIGPVHVCIVCGALNLSASKLRDKHSSTDQYDTQKRTLEQRARAASTTT